MDQNNFNSLVSSAAGLVAGAAGTAGSAYSNRKAFERMRNHDIEMFNLQKADRDDQNRYNSPAAQVARLAAAGINPSVVFGNGTSVAESSPVSGSPSASMSGTDFSQIARLGVDSALIPMQLEQMRKNMEVQDSVIAKNRSETSQTEKNIEWMDRLNQAKVDSMNASSTLDRGRYELLSTQKSEMLANIEKLEREANSEIERSFLLASQRMLNEASVREINQLLPLKMAFMSAQTENQKAQAALVLTNSMYQKGLIDGGYIDKVIEKVIADTKQSHAQAENVDSQAFRSKMKNALITGEGYSLPDQILGMIGVCVTNLIPGASHFLDR